MQRTESDSKLYERRAEIIQQLFAKLVDYEMKMKLLVKPLDLGSEPSREERLSAAGQAGMDFFEHFNRNRIFFSQEVCKMLDGIYEKLHGIGWDFAVYILSKWRDKEYIEKWQEAWNKVKDDIPKLREQLEREFRAILGIS